MTNVVRWRAAIAGVAAIIACENPTSSASRSRPSLAAGVAGADAGGPATITGGGHYNLAGLDVQFFLRLSQLTRMDLAIHRAGLQ